MRRKHALHRPVRAHCGPRPRLRAARQGVRTPRAGFNELMALRRLADLARLYSLAARIHALDPLKAAFRAHIKSTGLTLILDEEKVAPRACAAARWLLP